MRSYCIFILLLFCCAPVIAQYSGGNNDGYMGVTSVGQNSSPGIYLGGSNDGFTIAVSSLQNSQVNIFTGNGNDGYSLAFIQIANPSPVIYKGGTDDGFARLDVPAQNASPAIYAGGFNDGFHSVANTALNSLPQIYAGGINDGVGANLAVLQNSVSGLYIGGSGEGWSSYSATGNASGFVYIFTGTGNWNIVSNWMNNIIPPSPLPEGKEIKINPAIGSCIVNVTQVISPGAQIIVTAGKVLVVPGDLKLDQNGNIIINE
jgi:hypothetical protein